MPPPSLALMGPTVLYSQQIGVWRSFRRQLSISRCAIQFFPNNICWPLQGGLLWFFFSFFSFRGFSTAALLSTPQKAFVKANTQCRIMKIEILYNYHLLTTFKFWFWFNWTLCTYFFTSWVNVFYRRFSLVLLQK